MIEQCPKLFVLYVKSLDKKYYIFRNVCHFSGIVDQMDPPRPNVGNRTVLTVIKGKIIVHGIKPFI